MSNTSNIALDDAYAYWTFGIMIFDAPAAANGSVTRVPLAGGASEGVVVEQRVPTAMALNTNDVFWIDQYTRRIVKAPKAGGEPTDVVTSFNGSISELEVDEESVYFLNYDDGGPGIFKAPVAGGDAVRLATGGGQLQALALDDTHVYWTDYVQGTGTNRVMKVSIEGGEPVVLHSEPFGNGIADLAVGPNGVYWNGLHGDDVGADRTVSTQLLQISLAGAAPVVLAEESGISRIAVNSSHVYWAVQPLGGLLGAIRKVPSNGGTISTVASEQLGLTAFAVDDANVCWLNLGGGGTGSVVCQETCDDS